MKKILGLIGLLLLSGCNTVPDSNTILDHTVKHTGPVVIVISEFDYHETLQWPDGHQSEFNHCSVDSRLMDEGAEVDITYSGDPNELLPPTCANVLDVKVIRHSDQYIQDHPELWPPRKGHWQQNSYILDDTHIVCGQIDDFEQGVFYASALGDDSRDRVYKGFTTKEGARKQVEKSCR